MKIVRLDYTVLIVEDIDRSLDFYIDILGIPLGHRSGGYAQLRTGSTRLALYTRESMQETLATELAPPAPNAPAFEIGFVVEDVDATYADFTAKGATPASPPTTRPWGQRTAYLRDPDGHLVELVQQPT
jgi:lactoylglutathione lyase